MNPVGRTFRIVAAVEATTYLVLLAAVVTYRIVDGPDWTSTIGPIHGLAFVAYFAATIRERERHDWPFGRTAAVLLAAVIPLGGFFVTDHIATTGDSR